MPGGATSPGPGTTPRSPWPTPPRRARQLPLPVTRGIRPGSRDGDVIISGYAPGDGYGNGPDISYGSDSDTREARPAGVDGMVTYSVPFSPDARYYSVTVQLAGPGTCHARSS